MLTGAQQNQQQRKKRQSQHKPLQQILVIAQKKFIGNGYHTNPTLIGHSIVYTALVALQVDDIIIIALAQLAKNLVHIGLLLFNAQISIANGKHNISIGIAQIIIALARQAVIR